MHRNAWRNCLKVSIDSNRRPYKPAKWEKVPSFPAMYRRKCTTEPPLRYFLDSFWKGHSRNFKSTILRKVNLTRKPIKSPGLVTCR